jgi:chloride channel 3/4/5
MLDGECTTWRTWSSTLPDTVSNPLITHLIYILIATLFSIISSCLTLLTKSVYPIHSLTGSPNEKVLYTAAGSGIPEVKTILSGFVIRKFLGFKTLVVKAVGLTLSVASGMSLGKEGISSRFETDIGPFVHITCCVGNIACRIFDKYNFNDGKRREVLSASSAAGVAVAFAAPIGGVLFSLEEVSYYFAPKTMWRAYFCAVTAALTLKVLPCYLN